MDTRQEGIARLREIVQASKKMVFFGGAGVSTESGIPDFRSQDGLYRQKYKYPPEYILSRTFFDRHTEEFFEFYREKMLCLNAQPNAAAVENCRPPFPKKFAGAQFSQFIFASCPKKY